MTYYNILTVLSLILMGASFLLAVCYLKDITCQIFQPRRTPDGLPKRFYENETPPARTAGARTVRGVEV